MLEQISLWYKYKTKVWEESSPQATAGHNVMRVIRGIHNFDGLAYLSVPITSGKWLYENSDATIQQAITYNYRIGYDFCKKLEDRLDIPIVFPADLVAARDRWEQDHYQALWLSLIAEKCSELHMCDGWQFSNGGVEEFTHAMQLQLGLPRHGNLLFYNTKEGEEKTRQRTKNLAVYDHAGNSISLELGLEKVTAAISWVNDAGKPTRRLEHCKHLLQNTKDLLSQGFYQ